MAESIVGVDIGKGVIRAVEVINPSKPRPTLARYHSVVIPAGAAQIGEVVEQGTVAEALKQLWTQGGFKSKKVALGVGNQRVLVRDFSVPMMPIERIRESLPFQAQEHLPLPVAEALLDFYPISEGHGENGPILNGLLIAAVKEAVLTNVRAVQAAKLDPVEVDLIPFALSRILLGGADARGVAAIVEIGASTSTVIVARDGVPRFVRIVQNGSDDVNKALVQQLGVSPEQAEQVKRGLGLAPNGYTPDWKPTIEVIFSVASDLLANVRNTLSFWSSSRPGEPIERILLTGGGAEMPGLASALADVLRLPVGIPNPLERFTLARGVDTPELRANATSVGVAAGLALGSRK
ncbi:type IV pilus assembly protein PilM [Salinibacterium sp. ZJ77]|uniref:type IV pilus assembly protein PilM n=1 Tax=Salinibacterium sp. ZJ77 TaxID=2708337 RepID=UPI001422E814|nr:type IV pilus assembly protein PilM [Salinibacterium sp. ZJ77]